MIDATQDSVSTALGEILGIERDRVRVEEDDRRRSDEERRRRADEDVQREAEREHLRAQEEVRRRLDDERREREERERRAHQHRLDELRVRQEAEARLQLAREKLQLEHELSAAGPAHRATPRWAWAAMTLLLAGAGAAGVATYRISTGGDEALAASAARADRERQGWAAERGSLRDELRRVTAGARALQDQVRDNGERLARMQPAVDELPRDRARIAELEHENATLRQTIVDLQTAAETDPFVNRPNVRHPPHPSVSRPPPPVTTHRTCINEGTPLEECFLCPGDHRC